MSRIDWTQTLSTPEHAAVAAAMFPAPQTRGPLRTPTDPVVAFERAVSARRGFQPVAAVSGRLTAIQLALEAVGVRPGRQVLVPNLGGEAAAEAVRRLGASPVFVDCQPDRPVVAPASVERSINGQTAALVATDVAWCSPDLDALAALSRRHGVPLVSLVGTIEPPSAASPDVTVLVADEPALPHLASMALLTSGRPGLIDQVRRRRAARIASGLIERPTPIVTALANVELNHWDPIVSGRQRVALEYARELAGVEGVRMVAEGSTLITCETLGSDAVATLVRHLEEKGIPTRPLPAVASQSATTDRHGLTRQAPTDTGRTVPVLACRQAERWATRGLILPHGSQLTRVHIRRIVYGLTSMLSPSLLESAISLRHAA